MGKKYMIFCSYIIDNMVKRLIIFNIKSDEPSGAVLLKRSDNDIASALNPFNYNTEDLFTYGKRGYGDRSRYHRISVKSRDCSITRAVPYINAVKRSLIPYKRYTPQTYNSFKRSWGADDSLGSFMHQFSLSSVPSKRLMPMSQIPNLQADFSGNDMHLSVFL